MDVSRKVQMVKLCNEWNMNRIWPKKSTCAASPRPAERLRRARPDFRAGALDSQIDSAITCGLSTVIAFFHSLEERLGAEIDELDS